MFVASTDMVMVFVFLASLLVGLFVSFRLFYHGDYDQEKVLDLLLGRLLAGLIGGRALFVGLHWTVYRQNWQQIFNLSAGGFSLVGACLAYLVFVFLFLRRNKWPFLPSLSYLACGLTITLAALILARVIPGGPGAFLTAILISAMIFARKMSTSKQTLQREEQKLKQGLSSLRQQDPKNRPERTFENAPEEEGDEAEVGNRVAAIRRILRERLRNVRQALKDLRWGNYGICDKCGQKINPERLKAVPGAQYCLSCEKELEKQRKQQSAA